MEVTSISVEFWVFISSYYLIYVTLTSDCEDFSVLWWLVFFSESTASAKEKSWHPPHHLFLDLLSTHLWSRRNLFMGLGRIWTAWLGLFFQFFPGLGLCGSMSVCCAQRCLVSIDRMVFIETCQLWNMENIRWYWWWLSNDPVVPDSRGSMSVPFQFNPQTNH